MTADIDTIAAGIASFLRTFLSPDQVTELRVLPFVGNQVVSGFYDAAHIEQLAREAAHQSGTASGVYFVPNPIKPEVLTRRPNRAAIGKPKKGGMTVDADILRRHWLIIDIDPVRAKGHEKDSASDEEKLAAITLSIKVGEWLASAGWLTPLTIDSGNGIHLYYRLPTVDQSTMGIPTLLAALATLFAADSHAAHIDTGIGNPARIMKLPGTMSCKGTMSADRPWRTACIVGGVPSTWSDYPAIPPGSTSLISATIAAAEAAFPPGAVLPTKGTKGATTATVTLPPRLSAVGTSHYGAKALTEECSKIANAMPGTRNHTLFAAAAAVLELVAGGEIDAGEADGAIRTAAAACGLDDGEVTKSLRSAAATVTGKPRAANRTEGGELPEIPGSVAGGTVALSTSGGRPVLPTPSPTPTPTVAPVRSGPPQLRNYRISTDDKGDQREVGRPLGEITTEIFAKSGGWPKRIGSQLFVERTRKGEIIVDILTDSTQLFVWLSSVYEATSGVGVPGIDWGRGSDKPTRDDLYQSLVVSAVEYDSIELYPHYPLLPNSWYSHRQLPEPTGHDLNEFISMFCLKTPEDQDLLRAAILTMFWGGEAGQRPGFLITTDVGDGRGYGKTTLVQRVSDLVGGFARVDPNSNREATTMLLAPNAMLKRVAFVDNLKSLHFSSAQIESLITCPTIDGNKMYEGYGSRPNFLSWFLTVNGANLSKDLSQRFIPIFVRRPEYSSDWSKKISRFIAARRWHIIADAIKELQGQTTAMDLFTRKGEWEGDVLSKLPSPEVLAKLIAARQEITDGDRELSTEVEAAIVTALKSKGFNPETDQVLIKSVDMVDIVKPFTTYREVNTIMTWLYGLHISRVSKSGNKNRRGTVWNHKNGQYSFRYENPGLSDPDD